MPTGEFGNTPTTPSACCNRPLKKSVGEARVNLGRKARPSLLIVDAQSVKHTDSARHKGYDAGKKVSGLKRHLLVDTQGLPHGIMVTPADCTDRQGAVTLRRGHHADLPQTQTGLAAGGYSGQPFAAAVRQWLPQARVQIVKRSDLSTFVVLPKRWIVERSFAWLEKHRRHWKNCERRLNSSRQFVILALLVLLLNRL
jgi:transposase